MWVGVGLCFDVIMVGHLGLSGENGQNCHKEDLVTLDYTSDKEELSLGSSYHLLAVTWEESLLVFGSRVSQLSPKVPKASCACLVPAIIRIKDDVEMTAVPSENKEAIPVPLRCTMGVQCASCGWPLAHHCSSTCYANYHTKQLGYHPYSSPPRFMGQDIRFPCTREFHTHVLASGGKTDQGSSGDVEQSPGSQEDPGHDSTANPHNIDIHTKLVHTPIKPHQG